MPYGPGPLFVDRGPSLWDLSSNILTSIGLAVDSPAGERSAEGFIDSPYHNLARGSRAERRIAMSANATIWGGVKTGMKGLGKALALAGVGIAAKEGNDDFMKCGCGH